MSYSELTRARYSCRSYEDRAVEPEKLSAILEAGRIAPSALQQASHARARLRYPALA